MITTPATDPVVSPAPSALEPGTRVQRGLQFERADVNQETRTVSLSFSSEAPYLRWWGEEILSHEPQHIRLGRLMSGAALLLDHNERDQIGVIESVSIGADRKGRVAVRFSRSARGEEIYQDVLDGIRRSVSVGYLIHHATLQEKNAEGAPDTYLVDDWEPYEVSLVSVPADITVGVGRSANEKSPVISKQEINPISAAAPAVITSKHQEQRMEPNMVLEAEQRGAQNALARVNEINGIGQMLSYYDGQNHAREFIAAGKTTEEFRQHMLGVIASKPVPTSDIGLTEKEKKQFSFLRAIRALSATGSDKARAEREAGFEMECSNAVAAKIGKESRGIFVPSDVSAYRHQRDLTVGTSTAGGHTVQTSVLEQSFIEIFRNALVTAQAGARVLSGLVGPIAIPRQTGGATAYWVAESGVPTESQQAFDQVAMNGKTVGAFTDISRKLLLQSSLDVEAFVKADLAAVLALAVDSATINGTGSSNQPLGILATSGIGAVAGGTNGLAPTWANVVDLETQVSIANANIAAMAYVTNAKVRGKLKVTEKASSTAQFIWAPGNELNGYPGFVSNQVPSNLTKGSSSGVCSAIVFGNWQELIIGLWGVLDLMVDPYSQSTSGTVRVVALQDVDIAVRHASSFAAMVDALTT